MMSGGNGQQQVVSVPPGFRFHPTEEELLYYYLRKKVSYESIDLDVIKEVDLNKLEPWDLKDKCRIGSGPQNEWYFFSHKDKKYPTGSRTNRATTAGFWKATERDKAIHLSNSQRIGMRKTLVFYTGRAPHGHKTDWIMHEYRLDDDNAEVQEDGWVVCRVFTKKAHTKIFEPEIHSQEHHHQFTSVSNLIDPKQNIQAMYDQHSTFDGSMRLPQLFSTESSSSVHHPSPFLFPNSLSNIDMEYCSQNLLRLTSAGGGLIPVPERFTADWSFLDKLLTSHQNMDQQIKLCNNPSTQGLDHASWL